MKGRKRVVLKACLALACAVSAAAMTSCSDRELIETRVADLNVRIARLQLTKDEMGEAATSLGEVETKVRELEEEWAFKIKNFKRRESVANRRIAAIDAEINEKLAKIVALEEAARKYEADSQPRLQDARLRLNELMANLENSVDLQPREGERNVVVLERLLETIDQLRAENARLRESLPPQR